jgi:hypothetical protein
MLFLHINMKVMLIRLNSFAHTTTESSGIIRVIYGQSFQRRYVSCQNCASFHINDKYICGKLILLLVYCRGNR